MSCNSWRTKLDQYVDAELPDEQAVEMEAHLRQCQACAADALGRMRIKQTTHAAGRAFTPSPQFRLKIKEQIAEQKRRRFWAWSWNWQLGAAVVALVLAVVALTFVWSSRLQRNRELGELADLHVATLASPNPIDVVSTDRHTVKPWFAGKLPFTFNLPELNNTPFQLVGGRVAYFDQSPGAQLLFQVRKHQISVFIFSEKLAATAMGPGTSVDHKLEFTIETWRQDGLRYFVVGDASPADITALSELLKRAA